MQLKRYTAKELIDLSKNIFYDYMTDKNDEDKDGADLLKDTITDKINDYQDKIQLYVEEINKKSSSIDKSKLREALDYLEQGLFNLRNASMKFQKELYKNTGATDFSRSYVTIHLNKKINSYYDDLILHVLFYDDVCTANGKYDDYKKLVTKEEKIDFIKRNTEITHLGLVFAPRNQIKAVIGLLGNLNYNDPRVKSQNITLLPQKFADFKHLTLADTSEINNNDLKQFFQEKIDLDKEDMKELASLNIRGDIYKIYKSPEVHLGNNVLYIRYICRGTGRIYYNELNLNNLKISKEFKENDYESYAKSWWDLNTLGSSITGKPVTRL